MDSAGCVRTLVRRPPERAGKRRRQRPRAHIVNARQFERQSITSTTGPTYKSLGPCSTTMTQPDQSAAECFTGLICFSMAMIELEMFFTRDDEYGAREGWLAQAGCGHSPPSNRPQLKSTVTRVEER